MIRQRSAITDQQAPLAALQAAGPPALPKTAENKAQSDNFQTSQASSERQITEIIASSGVEKNRCRKERDAGTRVRKEGAIIYSCPKLIALEGNGFVDTVEHSGNRKVDDQETCHKYKNCLQRLP